MRRKEAARSKTKAGRSRRVPLWLRRLDQVKSEMRATQFPRTAEEGFRQCAVLSAVALRWLRDSIRDDHPGASRQELETEIRRLLVQLSAEETRWLVQWKKERRSYFQEGLDRGAGRSGAVRDHRRVAEV